MLVIGVNMKLKRKLPKRKIKLKMGAAVEVRCYVEVKK